MNYAQHPSLNEVQDYIAMQGPAIEAAREARKNIRNAMHYVREHFERTEVREVAERRPMLHCEDLIEDGAWLGSLCCQQCHARGARIHDGYLRCPVILCCKASLMLEGGTPQHGVDYAFADEDGFDGSDLDDSEVVQ